MLMSEFFDRTGFTPTYEEYQEIEEAYYNFDGNKDAFCKAFVDGNGEKRVCALRVTKIEKLKSQLLESDRTIKEVTAQYEQKLQSLQAELDKDTDGWWICLNADGPYEFDGYASQYTIHESAQFEAIRQFRECIRLKESAQQSLVYNAR